MSQQTPPPGPVPHGPPGPPSFLQPLEPGDPRQVGRYVLLGRLGAGGMGRVFVGRSPGGRLVAVKLIHPELAADAAFRARFGREIEAARRVGGMFTAPVVDADPQAPQPWLVTAYVPGPSLADAVARQGPLPAASVLALAAGLAEGLEAVHAAGLVHRDLKPSNVLLASDGPRIIDFGISRALEGTAVTRTDQVVGSPGFMSPEQADGHQVGPTSDVFSLGSVLAFAATGQGPFGTGPATALLYRVVHSPPATSGLPPQVRPLIGRCLAKDPAQRPTTSQLLAELGAPQLAADWLPPAIAHALLGYDLAGKTVGQDARTPTRATTGNGPSADPATVSAAGPGHPSLADTLLADAPAADQPQSPPRRRRWISAWAAGTVAVVLGLAATAVALTFHPSGGVPQRPPSTPANHATLSASRQAAGPQAVVQDFFAAINDHNWPRVWQLGGKNFGYTYPAFVAGFHQTARDLVTHLTTHGNSVSVRFLAYETTGAVQTYHAYYTVHRSEITSGQQTLLKTSYPQGNQPASPAALPVVYDCQGNPQIKPTSYILGCGDGNGSLSSLTWSSWTANSAQATGVLAANNCQPNCAQGTFSYTPATVTLTNPALGANGPYFTHLQLTDLAEPAHIDSVPLGRQGPQ
jgi:serine/threonine protein kinase